MTRTKWEKKPKIESPTVKFDKEGSLWCLTCTDHSPTLPLMLFFKSLGSKHGTHGWSRGVWL